MRVASLLIVIHKLPSCFLSERLWGVKVVGREREYWVEGVQENSLEEWSLREGMVTNRDSAIIV